MESEIIGVNLYIKFKDQFKNKKHAPKMRGWIVIDMNWKEDEQHHENEHVFTMRLRQQANVTLKYFIKHWQRQMKCLKMS